jgi:hypothetical protein
MVSFPIPLPLQLPGGPELVVIAVVLLPLVLLAGIGYVLVRRLLNLPDPNRVAELEREVETLRERVDELDDDR